MSSFVRVMTYGFISWLVPFIVSLALTDADGFVRGDYAVFRAIMFLTSIITAAVLLASHFRYVPRRQLREGILVGAVWLEINLSLDFMIVVPRSGLGLFGYITQIGVNYVGIPVLAVLVGFFLWDRSKHRGAEVRRVDPRSVGEGFVWPFSLQTLLGVVKRELAAGQAEDKELTVGFAKAASPAVSHENDELPSTVASKVDVVATQISRATPAITQPALPPSANAILSDALKLRMNLSQMLHRSQAAQIAASRVRPSAPALPKLLPEFHNTPQPAPPTQLQQQEKPPQVLGEVKKTQAPVEHAVQPPPVQIQPLPVQMQPPVSIPVANSNFAKLPPPPVMKIEPAGTVQDNSHSQEYVRFVKKLAEVSQQKPAQQRKTPARYSNLP